MTILLGESQERGQGSAQTETVKLVPKTSRQLVDTRAFGSSNKFWTMWI